jgi:hypothetical protein
MYEQIRSPCFRTGNATERCAQAAEDNLAFVKGFFAKFNAGLTIGLAPTLWGWPASGYRSVFSVILNNIAFSY